MEIVAEREVTALREGPVTVRKSALDLGRDGVSGVKLEISSEADHPVGLELHERVPGHLALSDIQVHPQYWPGKWRKDAASHRLVFEDELPPGGSIETIYGVRLTPDQLGPLLGDPELERVEVDGEEVPAETGAEEQPKDDEAAPFEREAEDQLGDDESAPPETDGLPDVDEGELDGAEQEQPEATADDGTDRFRYGEDRPSSDEPSVTDSPDEPEPPTGRATGAEDLETRAQLEALQTAVGELTAYVETLGRRLEEAGEPSAAIGELHSRQAKQDETLAELFDRLRTESERRAELAERLRDGSAERAALRDQVQAAEEHRDELSARLRAEEDDRATLAERVTHLEDQLVELRDRYEYQLESLVDRVDELESTFSPEESRAIREVIAAERRWKRQREARQRPMRTVAAPRGDR